MPVLKHIDLIVLAIALPVFLIAGFPMLGYLTGAVAYVVQKVVKDVAERRALEIARHATSGAPRDQREAVSDMRRVAGLTAGSMIGRGWFTALAIFGGYFAAGRDDAVGLAAAVLVITCFTAYFATAMVLRPFATSPNELPS